MFNADIRKCGQKSKTENNLKIIIIIITACCCIIILMLKIQYVKVKKNEKNSYVSILSILYKSILSWNPYFLKMKIFDMFVKNFYSGLT